MLAALIGEPAEPPRKPILPEAAIMRLREHQEVYAAWLLGPALWKPGDIVTMRRDCPIGGHGDLFMVVDVEREAAVRPSSYTPDMRDPTQPPPRSRRTGLREDVRVAFVANDEDSTVRAMWIEGWMLEPWSVEQAERHQKLAEADTGTRN